MLQCGANFERSYGGKICKDCAVVDENHGINDCSDYETVNLYNCTEKLNFDLIYTEDRCSIDEVERVLIMWDLVNGKNRMRE